MDTAKKYYFKKGQARVLGWIIVIAAISAPLAGMWGLKAGYAKIELLGLFLIVPLIWWISFDCYRSMVKPCFPTGVALELHEEHLVIATTAGLRTIPKKVIHGVWDFESPVYISVGGINGTFVELIVPDEYMVKDKGRSVSYPGFYGFMLKDHSDLEVRSAISWWLEAK